MRYVSRDPFEEVLITGFQKFSIWPLKALKSNYFAFCSLKNAWKVFISISPIHLIFFLKNWFFENGWNMFLITYAGIENSWNYHKTPKILEIIIKKIIMERKFFAARWILLEAQKIFACQWEKNPLTTKINSFCGTKNPLGTRKFSLASKIFFYFIIFLKFE